MRISKHEEAANHPLPSLRVICTMWSSAAVVLLCAQATSALRVGLHPFPRGSIVAPKLAVAMEAASGEMKKELISVSVNREDGAKAFAAGVDSVAAVAAKAPASPAHCL